MPPKRRRRFQGLYYHSSPPKVLPMNGQITNSNGRRRRDPDDLSIKLSTIRIWMHEKDIGKLTRVLWAGQGNRLRQQASTNPRVKRFLAAVPYVMNSIKDVHQAVIDNSLENLQANLEPPVPPALITSRDANGLNLIHKAAGLGHATILEYLINIWPDGVHETDITGKTPLHWAASAKNNMRCYTLLTQAGCDEEAVDYKMKTPSFYRHKPHEIERSFLTFVPEAPRVSPDVATDWEALSDESGDGKKLDLKIPEMNGFGRHSNAGSNTSEAEMTEAASGQEDEDISKDGDAAEESNEAEAENEDEKEPETKEENEGTEEPSAVEEAKEETEADEHEETEENREQEEPKEQNEPEENENEPQDEKLQIDTLNDTTTANLSKDSKADGDDDHETTESSQDHKKSVEEKELKEQESGDHKEENDKENLVDESKVSKESETEAKEETSEEKVLNEENEESKDIGESDDQKDNVEEVKETKVEETTRQEDLVEKVDDSSNEKSNKKGEEILEEKLSEQNNVEENKEDAEEKGKDSLEALKDDKGKDETKMEEGKVNENDKKEKEESRNAEEAKEKEDNQKDKEVLHAADKGKEKEDEDKEVSKASIENEKSDDDLKTEKKDEENTDNGSDEKKEDDDSKTLGEALVDIKDEVKDNVKYLANQLKNVFSDKTKNKDEKNGDDNSESKTPENKDEKENEEAKLDNNETKQEVADNEAQTKTSTGEKPIENGEIKESPFKESSVINDDVQNEKEKSATFPETTAPNTADSVIIKENDQPKTPPKTSDSTNLQENSNSSNDQQPPITTQTPPSSTDPKTPPIESPKKANDKTEEDENNNTSNMTNQTATSSIAQKNETVSKPSTAEAAIDDQFKELNKSLEEYKKSQTSLEETEKTIGDKLEEMADNLKDNVKEITDKVVNVFSNTKDNQDNLDNENNDVVVHGDSSRKSTPSKKLLKDHESSDDTADEDEEPRCEAENQENNEETLNDNEDKEAEAEPEKEPEVESEQEQEPEAEAEPEPDPSADNETKAEDEKEETKDPEDEAEDGEGSPTSSLAIEGFVQGDAEDNTVQSQTAAYVHDDEETRIQNIIASGDMEQLAQIVLNGDGQKLLNIEAQEPEIQAFLRNVPNYMGKIKRVHEAARNGSLLNLQQALDRRKFAIAKDEISPNGATPLHVAVLFGNSDIVRYLSARFPETTTITDEDGRTALHYAAVINDNGHFYNVLLQLGANPKVVDKMGHTPEDYLSKEGLKDTLNYGQLLKRFGAKELEEQLLNDQGQIENQSCQENPIFKTEQGKYLADNLADPLIKALTQVAHKRPTDPLQYLTNYLQSYVASRNTNGRTITQAAIHSGSSQTNSTRLATLKPSTPAQIRQSNQMNGHVKYANADNIEEDPMQQVQEFEGDDDDDSDSAMSKKLEERDEHGQSMLHFACARSHRKGGLIHLIEEAKADITYRDELYRTARDVALQANQLGNAKEIDRYVMSLAIVGDIKPFEHFAISGYDHIIDVLDENEMPIIDVVEARGLHELADYLKTIRPLEELREELHQMIRDNKVERVKEIADGPSGKWLIKAKNYYGRTALHIAILKESVEIVEYFIKLCPEALKIGDNLERTPLHYAMGTNIIESISRILIQNGAKRTYKDLKGRQPSYYFMNKADILRLQEEEDENR